MNEDDIRKMIDDKYDDSKEDTLRSMIHDFYNRKMISKVILIWIHGSISMSLMVFSGIKFFMWINLEASSGLNLCWELNRSNGKKWQN